MFDIIILAFDGSDPSERAALVTANLAATLGSKVIVVYAFDGVPRHHGDIQTEAGAAHGMSRGEEVTARAAAVLEQHGIDPEIELLEGPPAEAVLNVAEARDAALVVVGSHGHGGLSRALMGSVSRKILEHATCPVLVVR